MMYGLIVMGMKILVILNFLVMIENLELDDDSLEVVCGDDDEIFFCCEDVIFGF